MSNLPVRSIANSSTGSALCWVTSPPTFLAPSLARLPHARLFHATNVLGNTRMPANNPYRGLSPLRRTGIRRSLKSLRIGEKVLRDGLPQPVKNEEMPEIKYSRNHPLWQFFRDKKLLTEQVEDMKHGRAWTLAECRLKSFQQLHQLWYTCVKERNRLATEVETKKRLLEEENLPSKKAIADRDKTIRQTMKAVKWALTERWYAWEDAWEMAQTDPEIDLSAQPAYLPKREEQTQEDQPDSIERYQMA